MPRRFGSLQRGGTSGLLFTTLFAEDLLPVFLLLPHLTRLAVLVFPYFLLACDALEMMGVTESLTE